MNGTSLAAYFIVGSAFASLFSQLPPIFALDWTQQALQVQKRPPTRFWAGKARGNPTM
jgi:hypothetical protein